MPIAIDTNKSGQILLASNDVNKTDNTANTQNISKKSKWDIARTDYNFVILDITNPDTGAVIPVADASLINGSTTKKELEAYLAKANIKINAMGLWFDLEKNGYIEYTGELREKALFLKSSADLELSPEFNDYKALIYDFLKSSIKQTKIVQNEALKNTIQKYFGYKDRNTDKTDLLSRITANNPDFANIDGIVFLYYVNNRDSKDLRLYAQTYALDYVNDKLIVRKKENFNLGISTINLSDAEVPAYLNRWLSLLFRNNYLPYLQDKFIPTLENENIPNIEDANKILKDIKVLNQQKSELENQILEAQKKLAELNNANQEKATLDTEINNKKTELSELENKLNETETALNNKKSELEQTINSMTNKQDIEKALSEYQKTRESEIDNEMAILKQKKEAALEEELKQKQESNQGLKDKELADYEAQRKAEIDAEINKLRDQKKKDLEQEYADLLAKIKQGQVEFKQTKPALITGLSIAAQYNLPLYLTTTGVDRLSFGAPQNIGGNFAVNFWTLNKVNAKAEDFHFGLGVNFQAATPNNEQPENKYIKNDQINFLYFDFLTGVGYCYPVAKYFHIGGGISAGAGFYMTMVKQPGQEIQYLPDGQLLTPTFVLNVDMLEMRIPLNYMGNSWQSALSFVSSLNYRLDLADTNQQVLSFGFALKYTGRLWDFLKKPQ